MTKFIDRFKQYGDYSLRGMRKTAIALLPKDKSEQDALHEELNRGRDALEDENLLNMYLYSYGKMHKLKLVKAFVSLFEHVDFGNEEIEIYDWGCGQGLATMCFLDCLNYLEIKPNIKGIFLIDQSFAATNRASGVIKCKMIPCQIITIDKGFDFLNNTDFVSSDTKKLHLFSNILDVESYDLSQFAKLFQRTFSGDNYMVCVGPCYNLERLEEFLGYIEPDANYCSLAYDRGEWVNDWSIALKICYKYIAKPNVFSSIVINKEFIKDYSIILSSLRSHDSDGNPYTDPDGNPFTFYWVTFKNKITNEKIICCTGRKFTALLGSDADSDKCVDVLNVNEWNFEIAQAVDENGVPLFINDDHMTPLLKIQVAPCPWIDNYGAKYSHDWKQLLEGPNTKVVETMIVNNINFHEDDLWVSSPIKSKISGKTTYWCSFHSFENGALLYLDKCVWEGLSIVNKDTVWDALSSGKYIIREARDVKTNEWLMTSDNKPIMMIDKTHFYAHADWDDDVLNHVICCCHRELDEAIEYSIKLGTSYISDNAFSCCKSLQIVTIPKSVESVGNDIFKGCDSLKEINIPHGTFNKYARLLPQYENMLVEEESLVDDLPF